MIIQHSIIEYQDQAVAVVEYSAMTFGEIGKFDKVGKSMDDIAENMILMQRYSSPDDVLGTATFLASQESDCMTGQLLMIDGGMVIQ